MYKDLKGRGFWSQSGSGYISVGDWWEFEGRLGRARNVNRNRRQGFTPTMSMGTSSPTPKYLETFTFLEVGSNNDHFSYKPRGPHDTVWQKRQTAE